MSGPASSLTGSSYLSFVLSLFVIQFMVTLIKNLKGGLRMFLYTFTAVHLERRQWEKCNHSVCDLDSLQGLHDIQD